MQASLIVSSFSKSESKFKATDSEILKPKSKGCKYKFKSKS